MNKLLSFCREFGRRLLAFPCPGCGKFSDRGDNLLCTECLRSLPLLTGKDIARCPGCGGRADNLLGLCSKCLAEPERPWQRATALMEFRGFGRELLLKYKFGGHPEIFRSIGDLITGVIRQEQLPVEVLVPIPLHWTRLCRRGFNQAALPAQRAAEALGLPILEVLGRRWQTGKQARRNRRERHQSLTGAFYPRKNIGAVAGRNVLLIDDILTTGATLTAAADVLRRAGAAEIYVLVFARR